MNAALYCCAVAGVGVMVAGWTLGGVMLAACPVGVFAFAGACYLNERKIT